MHRAASGEALIHAGGVAVAGQGVAAARCREPAIAAIEVVEPEAERDLPAFPDPPQYSPVRLARAQRYHLEVVCEKTTRNEVLVPLCRQYGMNLQTGTGELSITAALKMVRRIEQVGKPARVFSISDA